ncbi:MAG: DUF2157 domain-containing protein [Verrucomicrobiales bacterium]|nr:DUF2157 domain-containing protein [Verrucomicrobiales bacterium]
MQDGDSLDKPLSRTELERLDREGLLSPEKREEIFSRYRESIDWAGWISKWAGALGGIFLLAGVLFFFASNWKEMSPFLRFGVLEGGVLLAATAALVCGLRKRLGNWLLVAASVLTGVLIAVFGQVYQTGADAFEVFALWAALIFLWVLAAKFAPLWMLWVVVAETALILFAGQVMVPKDNWVTWPVAFLGLADFTIGMLVLWEWLQSKERFAWLRGEWIRIALVITSLFWLSIIVWMWIFETWRYRDKPQWPFWAGTLAWMLAVGIGFWFYSKKRPSLISVSACVLVAAGTMVCWLARWILDSSFDGGFGWLMVGMCAIGLFTGAAFLIIRAAKQISGEAEKRES